MTGGREQLATIHTFAQLVRYLRDELDWPVTSDDFEDLFFDYSAEDLGIDAHNAAKIQEIKRLRPLSVHQPWGVFFVKFEPKRLPVVALRRILSSFVLKRRASANGADRTRWNTEDLLFISSYGEGEERQINFAHFAQDPGHTQLPTLKVLGWDGRDTLLHVDYVADTLHRDLGWPNDETDSKEWIRKWGSAFTLSNREVITTSRELAIRLATLARTIRALIASGLGIETSDGPLTRMMKAFQDALIHDLDANDFADMYAQTIAYGLLSSRITNPHAGTGDDRGVEVPVTNPFLKELLEAFLAVSEGRNAGGRVVNEFDELGVSDVVQVLSDANMEAVIRDFGDRNPEEDPVIHFYELFLEEYDAKKRMERGVFYTPRPVVSYIVRSVDEILRTEFGLDDGLADVTTWAEMLARMPELRIPEGASPDDGFVQILDPATGTGTFLVEVIDVIFGRMQAKWRSQGQGANVAALWNAYVPKHLLPRLHGYELLMAPYAIAHVKVGLKLYETGYRFRSDQRAQIFLTNSLEPAQDFTGRLAFAVPALAREARAVSEIKQHQRFTVVIGNPPYSGASSNMFEAARRMVDAYRTVDGAPLNERKLWLQDDYVKFVRLGQMLIDEAGIGVLGFITNHGYLDNPTFRGMRQSLMATFSPIRVLDLHGNANKREQPPDGGVDQNVFDIRQGVAVLLATRNESETTVWHQDLWGLRRSKYSWFESHSVGTTDFSLLDPHSPFYFFEPHDSGLRSEYEAGYKLTDAMPLHGLGFQTSRDHLVVAFTAAELEARIDRFLAPNCTDDEARDEFFPGKVVAEYLPGDTRQWSLSEARRLMAADRGWRLQIRKCLYRPFDWRYVLYDSRMVDWPRPEVLGQMLRPNLCLIANRQSKEDFGALCSADLTERKIAAVYDASTTFPLYRYPEPHSLGLTSEREPNFSRGFLVALGESLGVRRSGPFGLPEGITSEDIVHYIYSVFHSHGYRTRYATYVSVDFPRIPLPSNPQLFGDLAGIGSSLVDIHLMTSPALDRSDVSYVGPANPQVGRTGWFDGTIWLDAPSTKNGMAERPGSAGIVGVPKDVWAFHVGGYQVCEKWLKDRKGRRLSLAEIVHLTKIVGAIAETLRLMSNIDEVIDLHGGWPAAFEPNEH